MPHYYFDRGQILAIQHGDQLVSVPLRRAGR
jgi:hypothetical protein